MISLNLSAFRQRSAHFEARDAARLAERAQCDIVKSVVAAHVRAETHCLNRYPSPMGRTGCPQGRSPRFFLCEGAVGQDGRVLAATACPDENSFHSGHGCGIWGCIRRTTSRGISCKSNSRFGLSPFYPSGLSRPAVTRRSNRRSWGAGPGRPRPSCSTAASAPVRLSVPRPTSPIARNTRRAADRARLIPAFGPLHASTAIAGITRGGRFVAFASGDVPPQPRNGRDETCSRRS